ncbi:GNAT family N-acetyltransferase [Pedobacter fastidiosus]|uniref:GNAT family N-acetyltransferase n=1 Tax=Pedobacter fastidiosus TaxID=2765361 RepID=A0ABR7KLP5_9SPHI|nr:GNAT family N-acetyltransferase [Pedobacter fastidiosus]MBC6108994.1 GNAT family N-acetyltransferase [Pedobacter fastidiosus]
MLSKIVFAKQSDLDDILRIWGPNRQTLGLMPKDAFKESIAKKWVLICKEEDSTVGYLQFRFTNRTQILSIVHLCVEKEYRGKGYPELMVNKLVSEFRSQARGIKLNCRSDYKKAEAFWNRYGFQPKSKQPSRGNNRSIELITWWYNFGVNDLFSTNQNHKVKAILDLNILAKIMEPALNDNTKEQIAELINDWIATEVEYYYASETINELFRDKINSRQEKTKQFLKDFTELNIDKSSLKDIERELLSIYPGKTDNHISDRRQISEAVLSGFPYFITLDAGILKNSKKILEKYPLKIVEPFQFSAEIDFSINAMDYYPNQLSANNFSVSKLNPQDRDGLESLFLNTSGGERKSIFKTSLDGVIAKSTGCVMVIKEGMSIVSIVGYHLEDDYIQVPLIRTKQYTLRQTIFMQNINDLVKLASDNNKSFLALTDHHITSVEAQILQDYGFFEIDQKWIRGVKKGFSTIEQLKQDLSVFLKEIPQLRNFLINIEDNKNDQYNLNMLSLEKALWPLKIIDAEIPCFIIPIKPHYARELFDTKAAKAELFGVQPKLIWNKENVYYRNVSPNVEKFPARILWYASDSQHSPRSKGIVCSSYLNEVVIGGAKEVFKKYERFGVYSWEKDIMPLAKNVIDKNIKILRFSDSESFQKIVTLKEIKRILSENGEKDNNFQSPMKIKNTTFMEIYALGKGLNYKP